MIEKPLVKNNMLYTSIFYRKSIIIEKLEKGSKKM